MEQLDAFFHEEALQDHLRRIMYADTIRAVLGRPIEVYLLLDRWLYLQENGYKVQLLKFFDEDISPRAMGVFATLIG